MSENAGEPPLEQSEDPQVLQYVRPRLIRRYQRGGIWKAVVRVVGGMMASMALAGVAVSFFSLPLDVLFIIIGLAGGAALLVLLGWERGYVLREPLWDEMKDLRAQTYRQSASRYDSSGVTIVDPNSPGGSS